MSTAELKLNLINQIAGITDKVRLKEIMQLLEFQSDKSLYITNKEEKEAVKEAQNQIKNGDGISNEDVQKEIKTCENEIKNAKQEYAKPFPYEELLKENITRQMEIDAELEIKDQEECVEVQEETKNLPCQTAVR